MRLLSPSEAKVYCGLGRTPGRWSRQRSPVGGQNLTGGVVHGLVEGMVRLFSMSVFRHDNHGRRSVVVTDHWRVAPLYPLGGLT